MTLRLDFISLSPGHPGLAAIDAGAMLAEVDRELDARRRTYPARVAKGSMTPAEADREIAVMAAIRADLSALREWDGRGAFPLFFETGAGQTCDREAKLHVLRREIHMRRTFYPQWVGKGRLSATLAREQLHRLEAVQCHYWLDFWGGPRPTRAEADAHFDRVAAAIGKPWETGDGVARGGDNGQPAAGRSAGEDPRMNERSPQAAML